MQRNLFLLLLASVVALAVVGSPTSSRAPPDELKRLTVDQVAARIAAHDGKTFIYDNNPKESWVAGHVPGARWLDDESVTADALPADMAATLIFYCHNEG
jgi:3-mercaptopyruvate sulfurtransferase SseA